MELLHDMVFIPLATYVALGVIALGSLQLWALARGAPEDEPTLAAWLDRHPGYMVMAMVMGIAFMPVMLAGEAILKKVLARSGKR